MIELIAVAVAYLAIGAILAGYSAKELEGSPEGFLLVLFLWPVPILMTIGLIIREIKK